MEPIQKETVWCVSEPAQPYVFLNTPIVSTLLRISNSGDTVICMLTMCRSQWLRVIRRGSAAARLLGLRVRILPEAWMTVVSVCVVR
jgi:ABC-type Fe3+-siderophore transport system permease subunit